MSQSPVMETGQRYERLSPADENPSTPSDPATESEDLEISDDDDRNHKHRRREADPHSVSTHADEQSMRRPNRKRKPFESRQMFLHNESTSLEGNVPSKFEKRRTILTMVNRVPPDLASQTRVGQAFRPEFGPRFDGSIAGRPFTGRGRGRNTGFWNQQHSRLSSLDPLDFSSQLPSQGPPAHPSLFVGGFPSAASTQTASWGAYGYIHPMGMQGALQPTISPLLNMGVPRQRCRDFEEQGFCLRGDMCPMEHGVNRIVVEDVQSLSQFNLPVSIPSLQVSGSAGSVSLTSGLPAISNSLPVNDGQCTTDDTLIVDGVPSGTSVAEADVYDPDQPLWNNECPEPSDDHLQLPVANDDDESLWNTDHSGQGSLMLSDGFDTVQQKRVISNCIGNQSSSSSVWGRRNRHGKKSDMARKTSSNAAPSNQLENDIKDHKEDGIAKSGAAIQGKHGGGKEMGSKTAINPLTKLVSDSGPDVGRTTKKASRTLYLHGIPQKNNCREALLSHFHKFGNVVDIYIPLNSEIAFVQFSKREEAEAALKAPDAVMGNRFIKLWWANRDRVHVDEEGSAYAKFSRSSGISGSSLPSQPSSTEQVIVPSASVTRIPAAGSSVPVTGPPKTSATNGSTTPRTIQKKPDNLDLLEELRKKQEMLAKKRDEFRRQLDKFEKQTSFKKVEPSSEPASKRHKGDNAEVVTPRQEKITVARGNRVDENLQKGDSEENVLPSALNGDTETPQTACGEDKNDQHELLLDSVKLHCQPSSFLILPPLPSGFADVAVLKDHFSVYGDLDSVVFEGPVSSTENKMAEPTIDSSVCVSFIKHDSAERAYTNGRCWESQSLRFVWKTVSPSSSNNCHESEIVEPPQHLSFEIKDVPSAASDNHSVTSTSHGETLIDMEFTADTSSNTLKVLPRASCSSPSMASCEEQTPVSDASIW